eukprot:GHUV01043584.1.p1 GENE.GHUV01043584.1~~GHUV01043584.1.p1  ORF type:complete len:350 (+),score=45.47 GHUV01043584.1:261-1310(+)
MASAAKLLRTLHEYVRNKAVLILVDNVWSAGQVDKLLPGVFGKGSRIIITSRSSRLPDSLWWQQVNHQLLHRQMVQLPAAASVQLLHASANLDPDFQMPSKELLDAEMALIAACKGLPLALQLTGASLYAKEHNKPPPVAQWKEALTALQDGRNEADSENLLKGILSTTFKALQPAQKHMFLDVAAALRGQPTDLALEVWDIWHGGGARQRFEGLERRNLLSHRRGNLQMHDVLVALGRNLLLNGGEELPTELYGSRVWVDQKGVLQGYRKVSAICKVSRCTSRKTSTANGSCWRHLGHADRLPPALVAANSLSSYIVHPSLCYCYCVPLVPPLCCLVSEVPSTCVSGY